MTNEALAAELLEERGKFQEHFNASDLDKLMSIFGREILTIPPDREAFTGLDKLRETFAELLSVPNITIENDPVTRVDADVDLGYTSGSYTFRYDTPLGPVAHYGRSTEVWRRDSDGNWLVVVDMWHELPEGTVPQRADI